jgi:hypothetical protein
LLFGREAQAAPSPPAPGSSPAAPRVDVVLPVGGGTVTLAEGAGFSLQPPAGGAWAATMPVQQTQGSVVGGTVSPLVPTGAEVQTWDNVTGNGTIVASWVDANGQAQQTMLDIVTKGGGPHPLGGAYQYGNPQTTTVALTTM